MTKIAAFAVIIIAVEIAVASEKGFCQYTYTDSDHGLDKWGEVCHSPVCNSGQSQSPIDLSNPDKIHSLETGVKFIDYHQMTEFNVSNTWRLTKNHVLSITVLQNSTHPSITGGPLGDAVYRLLQFHFHWGSNRFSGSEHAVQNRRYPSELHFVHVLDDHLADVGTALKGEKGRQTLAVVAFFLEVTEGHKYEDNVALGAFLELMRDHAHVSTMNDTYLKTLALESRRTHRANVDTFLPPDYRDSPFYHYNGSLTTPPCSEVVAWIVMEEPIKISINQLQTYFHQGNYFDDFNHRPLQQRNGRRLIYYAQNASSSQTPAHSSNSLINMALILLTMATLFCLWIVVIIRITSTKAH